MSKHNIYHNNRDYHGVPKITSNCNHPGTIGSTLARQLSQKYTAFQLDPIHYNDTLGVENTEYTGVMARNKKHTNLVVEVYNTMTNGFRELEEHIDQFNSHSHTLGMMFSKEKRTEFYNLFGIQPHQKSYVKITQQENIKTRVEINLSKIHYEVAGKILKTLFPIIDEPQYACGGFVYQRA